MTEKIENFVQSIWRISPHSRLKSQIAHCSQCQCPDCDLQMSFFLACFNAGREMEMEQGIKNAGNSGEALDIRS